MAAILPSVNIDADATLAKHFMVHQINWIEAEDAIHAQGKQVFALAEKSVRIGWTTADGFKNIRKRLRFPKRDYLFVTKDFPSALEYMMSAYGYLELFERTGDIVSHGEEYLKVPRVDERGRPSRFTEEIKIGVIKFSNGSRIIAFSSNPQAMAVYGGDVGLDEFARHPQAELLWETAQGRIALGHDLAVWSAHSGDDTLFYLFAQEARAGKGPWNLYYRVTMPDAVGFGLLDIINRERKTRFTPEQFLSDCRARAGQEHIYQQTYLCNPVPGGAAIVEWSAIERCRSDYEIARVHLEHAQILEKFGPAERLREREEKIVEFIRREFRVLFQNREPSRLGFDVAASGEGDLGAMYIDQPKGSELWLRGLLTTHTDDWHFLTTALFCFLRELPSVQAAGDEGGLGRQICWEAAQAFSSRFTKVNFTSKKQDLGFALMNQLSVGEKRFPRSEQDIAADYFALRKAHLGNKWVFSESHNTYNPASHCDIAWAGALSSHAHSLRKSQAWALAG
jgi:phage FluMu gp28-like protein